MARITPPLRVKGVFQLRTPFSASPSVAYTVTAIRTFEEIRARATDPMVLVYEPVGLTAADYAADIEAGAAIITLQSSTGAPIYVPDTYIESYPNMGNVNYSHLVCSASLGPLPDSFDTTLLAQVVSGAISDFIGVSPVVNIGRAELTTVVSSEQHTQLTAARQGSVNNRVTDRARALAAESLAASRLTKIQALEAMVTSLKAQLAAP